MQFSSMPILVGLDGEGETINFLLDNSNKTTTSGYVNNFANTVSYNDVGWKVTEVTSIYSSPTGIVALGYGVDGTGKSININWRYDNSSWLMSQSPFDIVRNNGIDFIDGKFLIADSTNVYQSDMLFKSEFAGTFSMDMPSIEMSSNETIPVDNLSVAGATVVGASLSSKGTWSPESTLEIEGDWDFNVGESTLYDTGHKSTSFTFPGYAGSDAQIQKISAITTWDSPTIEANIPPTIWNTTENLTDEQYYELVGYYGLSACPTFSVSWHDINTKD